MATHYLYGNVLTSEAVAANNRGDNIGNTTTLQKVFCQDDLHTSVSAEAIRFAIRYRFQLESPDSVNRHFNSELVLEYKDEKRTTWKQGTKVYIDDDLMGFMDAVAAAQEQEQDESQENRVDNEVQQSSKSTKKKPPGTTTKRQSPLAIGRAISLRPYRGEISFNCVSARKEKGKLSLYNAEMHTTEYQFFFGLNLKDVVDKANIASLIDAIVDPTQVAGNHARFAYDFSPASIVFRVTNAHSSRIQNCFRHDEVNRTYAIEKLVRLVQAGDIPAGELLVAGEATLTDDGAELEKLGVTLISGVYAAAQEVKKRIAALGKDYSIVLNT